MPYIDVSASRTTRSSPCISSKILKSACFSPPTPTANLCCPLISRSPRRYLISWPPTGRCPFGWPPSVQLLFVRVIWFFGGGGRIMIFPSRWIFFPVPCRLWSRRWWKWYRSGSVRFCGVVIYFLVSVIQNLHVRILAKHSFLLSIFPIFQSLHFSILSTPSNLPPPPQPLPSPTPPSPTPFLSPSFRSRDSPSSATSTFPIF